MRTLLCCLLVGPLLSLTACTSSDEEPTAAAPTVDEAGLVEGLEAMYAGDNPDPDDLTEGDCFADALLASTSPEMLRDAGLVDASYAVVTDIPKLEGDLAGPVADAQLGCTDFIEDSTAAQVAITKGGLDREAYAECLTGELDADTIRASVIASLMGEWGHPAIERLSTSQTTCARRVEP